MRNLVRFVVLLFLCFPFTGRAIEPDCGPAYAIFGQHVNEFPISAPVPLAALKKAMPTISDPANFARNFRSREAARATAHPNDPLNFPVPEHAATINELKQLLQTTPLISNYRYRDSTSMILTKSAREKAAANLQKRIGNIESRGYPHLDTIALTDEILDYLRRIDPAPESPHSFAGILKEALTVKVELSTVENASLKNQFDELRLDATESRAAKLKSYEEALIAAFQKQLDVLQLKVNAREILRRYSFGTDSFSAPKVTT